ncbi:MAG: rod shape-determining protein MreC [Candidatus Thermofonsia Clade 1 bacterium]|jgi:rod shape-determining protein MreC|uniref:Cell shape-determining protein MreC n=1 Tax=Candidatus Thermofonsia Clade 1 bacterium TaxID=2364210 RepID=A0A2M8PA95_9CHLR|nr:MAG: rod shape-determining protein MreC [Candidatus Thermofonsia Clade 1 bacterium]PJF42120.1 MAG: rod shape-determining protein MreC [Candidatus Thermofonsia Clade 1 bacterium]
MLRSAPSRLIVFGVFSFIMLGIFFASLIGLLSPIESLVSLPLGLLQQAFGGITRQVSEVLSTVADLQDLRRRNTELERALINFQAELVELRELRADYQRLAALQNYRGANTDKQFLAATVIGRDTTGLLRSIILDRGSRDGVRVGMPVVTELGLVGRIYRVGATTSQVQLITDTNSFVNARLQLTRAEGAVQGTAAGGLRMLYIPLADEVRDGDSVVTSGIGGKFPRGILIGQVTSSRLDDSKLFKEAQVRSLIDFNRLEIVLIITNFEPADLTTFSTPTAP